MCLIVYSNDHAPLTVRPIYSSSKLRTAQMMIFSLVAMIGLKKCCITSACHSGERTVDRGSLVCFSAQFTIRIDTLWAQLLLEFSTDHFELMHTCSTWSVGMHLVLGLSSHF